MEIGEMEELERAMRGWSPSVSRKDRGKWWLADDGVFTVQKLRNLVEANRVAAGGNVMEQFSAKENLYLLMES